LRRRKVSGGEKQSSEAGCAPHTPTSGLAGSGLAAGLGTGFTVRFSNKPFAKGTYLAFEHELANNLSTLTEVFT